jgi:hypothetical protein
LAKQAEVVLPWWKCSVLEDFGAELTSNFKESTPGLTADA